MTLITGYVEFKRFDFGPVDAIFSHNEIEGFRFRLGPHQFRLSQTPLFGTMVPTASLTEIQIYG